MPEDLTVPAIRRVAALPVANEDSLKGNPDATLGSVTDAPVLVSIPIIGAMQYLEKLFIFSIKLCPG